MKLPETVERDLISPTAIVVTLTHAVQHARHNIMCNAVEKQVLTRPVFTIVRVCFLPRTTHNNVLAMPFSICKFSLFSGAQARAPAVNANDIVMTVSDSKLIPETRHQGFTCQTGTLTYRCKHQCLNVVVSDRLSPGILSHSARTQSHRKLHYPATPFRVLRLCSALWHPVMLNL